MFGELPPQDAAHIREMDHKLFHPSRKVPRLIRKRSFDVGECSAWFQMSQACLGECQFDLKKCPFWFEKCPISLENGNHFPVKLKMKMVKVSIPRELDVRLHPQPSVPATSILSADCACCPCLFIETFCCYGCVCASTKGISAAEVIE